MPGLKQIVFQKVFEGGVLLEACRPISAISGNKGGDPLVNKGVCEFRPVVGNKKSVQVRMNVDKSGRNDFIRAVDDLAINSRKDRQIVGNLQNFIFLNKNMPRKTLFPGAINNTAIFQ